MKKIPTLFERDWNSKNKTVIKTVHPGCEWVLAGEGKATRKLDGTSCLLRDGALFKRREVARGLPLPSDFELVDEDEETGKRVGWVPVTDAPGDKWHRDALIAASGYPDGTYELIGPKVQGNKENLPVHILAPHSGAEVFYYAPRTFAELREWLRERDIEGLVFHHPDGRMAKIKKRDFGLPRVSCLAATREG